MMTKGQREEIQARCYTLLAEYDKSKVAWLLNDAFAVLDALDEAEAENRRLAAALKAVEHHRDMAIKTLQKAEADRWKSRAEVYWRIIEIYISVKACCLCVNHQSGASACESCWPKPSAERHGWRLNEARFMGGKETHAEG